MKIVQSFWTRPYMRPGPDPTYSGLNAGWHHRIHNYYSWGLSCLQLRKFYDQVELVTDCLGKEILIDRMALPYTSVSVALNELADCDAGTWSLGKLHAYRIQKEPFLHVDGDIFIFGKFDRRIEEAPLTAQNPDYNYPGYRDVARTIWEGFTYLPDYFKPVYEEQKGDCCNMGITGGTDVGFFQQWVDEAFIFFQENKDFIVRANKELDPILANIVLEQGLYYYYARHHQREITYLFPNERNNPRDIGFFHAAAANNNYVHCYGFYKGLRTSYASLEWKLKSDYPWYHRRIRDLVASFQI